jgi:Winged helix DNA-binding domain
VTSHSKNLDAEHLRQLTDEVSRVAQTLARLAIGSSVAQRKPQHDVSELPEVSAAALRAVIGARRKRQEYFPAELFADPAWDMMLDLLEAEISHRRVAVSSVCIAAAVPATTALRWLKAMAEQGMIIRISDPHDARRVFVELSPEFSRALRHYFSEVGVVPGI